MELTAAAAFLNNAFAGYDNLILSLFSKIQCGFLTFLFKLITLIGEKGLIFFFIAAVFLLFPKTRKQGVCLFGAVCCGALITNIILKDAVARPRPFYVEPFMTWWRQIGSPAEDGFSFPSGHATAAAAGMVALRLMRGKKWTVPAIVWILLIMVSRNYLMAHYPSDVLVGALIGTASAFIAWFITILIYKFLYANRQMKWVFFILDFSVPDFAGIPSRLGLTGPEEGEEREEGEAEKETKRTRNHQTEDRREKKHTAKTAQGRAAFTAGYRGKHER